VRERPYISGHRRRLYIMKRCDGEDRHMWNHVGLFWNVRRTDWNIPTGRLCARRCGSCRGGPCRKSVYHWLVGCVRVGRGFLVTTHSCKLLRHEDGTVGCEPVLTAIDERGVQSVCVAAPAQCIMDRGMQFHILWA